ncbi:ferritin family protein [Candidatus Caldatribacterium saccharofermentans]|uniref:Rubrerythrin diiron-binding domain-containing protein n=1 Tax=Candidatus Caldatribacterium saccharofermentans TaxID=1454753 RepID=A0A7V4THT4_9BACT
MNLEVIFEFALKMEEDGRQFYLSGISRVANPLSKEVLKRLADEELVHIERIQEGFERISKGQQFVFESWGGIRKSTREYFENIFTEAQKHTEKLIPPTSEELDILQTAMDLESKAHRFYVEKRKEVQEKDVQDFLDFLASEEYRHYNLLFNTYEYLRSPEEWHFGEEKPIFEGG